MRACRAVPQVGDLTQVLRQVILMVGLVGQLQVTTERVQPHWVRPVEANENKVSKMLFQLILWKTTI